MSDYAACTPRDLNTGSANAMIYGQLGLGLLLYSLGLIHNLIRRIVCPAASKPEVEAQHEAQDWQELARWHAEVVAFEEEAHAKMAAADVDGRVPFGKIRTELVERAGILGEKRLDSESADASETWMERGLGTFADLVTTNNIRPREEWQEMVRVWRGAKLCKFLWHVRTQANFIRDNTDLLLIRPPMSTSETCPTIFTHYALYRCICRARTFITTLTCSCTYALLSGALGSYLWLVKYEAAIGEREESSVAWIDDWATGFSVMSSDYKFFPVFLLFGCGMLKVVDRYMEWLVNLHTVQARIHDIGVMVGGGLLTAKDPETRKLVFRLYRYLNLVHALTYTSVNKALPRTMHEYQKLGLLTCGEVADLLPMENKIRETVMSWVSSAIKDLQARGALDSMSVDWSAVAQLRGICGRHHDLFRRNLPNLWIGIMRLAIDMLLIMETAGMPFRGLTFNTTSLCDGGNSIAVMSFQFTTLAGVFLISFAFMVAFDVVRLLSNPFTGRVDAFNTTAVLCSTEQTLFASLRGQFTKTCRFFNTDEDVLPPADGDQQAGKAAPKHEPMPQYAYHARMPATPSTPSTAQVACPRPSSLGTRGGQGGLLENLMAPADRPLPRSISLDCVVLGPRNRRSSWDSDYSNTSGPLSPEHSPGLPSPLDASRHDSMVLNPIMCNPCTI